MLMFSAYRGIERLLIVFVGLVYLPTLDIAFFVYGVDKEMVSLEPKSAFSNWQFQVQAQV